MTPDLCHSSRAMRGIQSLTVKTLICAIVDAGVFHYQMFDSETPGLCHPRRKIFSNPRFDVGLFCNSKFDSKTPDLFRPRRGMFCDPRFDSTSKTPDLSHPRQGILLPNKVFTGRYKAVLLLWFTISVIICLCMYVLVKCLFWIAVLTMFWKKLSFWAFCL